MRLSQDIEHVRESMGLGWCCFRNYVAHAEEIGGDISEYPRFFLKPASSHVEADENGNNVIELLRGDEHIDHEVELVVRLDNNLQPEAMCIGCDTTNRTRQTHAKGKGWPWTEGKAFRGSGVLGTWTQYDESAVQLTLSVNGEIRQNDSTKLMIHSVAEILEFLKEWYDLSPGDLIWTGTPKGVGPMKIGDEVKAEMRNSDSEIISKFYAVCQ